jgi:hypothetical protein
MSEKPTRVRMLIGVYRSDAEDHPAMVRPLVAGCVDEGVWEIEPQEDTDGRWRQFCAEYKSGDNDDYLWREIVVELDTAFLRHLLIAPTLKGVIRGSAK